MGEGWHGGHAEPRELTGSSEAERGQGMATGPGRGKAPREGAPVASGKGATGPGLVPRDCQRNSAGDGSPLPGRGSGRDARDPSPGWRPGPLGSSWGPCIEGGIGGAPAARSVDIPQSLRVGMRSVLFFFFLGSCVCMCVGVRVRVRAVVVCGPVVRCVSAWAWGCMAGSCVTARSAAGPGAGRGRPLPRGCLPA